MTRPNGIVLWEGPSPIDGAPLVCIATGLVKASANRKIGALVQTWILRRDMAPHAGVATGGDVSTCGLCPLRPHVAGEGVRCYVRTSDAPLSVYKAFLAGKYPRQGDAAWALAKARLQGMPVRAGSYGDPAMVPAAVWAGLHVATGYTHQWKAAWAQAHKAWCMASVDGPGDMAEARAMGWRCFAVVRPGGETPAAAVQCVADTHGTTCADCRLCGGLQRAGARDIWIQAHGATARCEGPQIPQLTGRGRLQVFQVGGAA